jgi:hypothetical protein
VRLAAGALVVLGMDLEEPDAVAPVEDIDGVIELQPHTRAS